MTYERFVELCDDTDIHPESESLPTDQLLLALWHDHRGHWVIAHRITQSVKSAQANALHAYLHREEGDLSNAQYWYSRAGRAVPTDPLEAEWKSLAREFCENT